MRTLTLELLRVENMNFHRQKQAFEFFGMSTGNLGFQPHLFFNYNEF